MEDEGMMMPPGFRFYPTEEELIGFYLREKLQGNRKNELEFLIPVLHIYDYNPWDLPQLAGGECRKDGQLQEWFFFIPRQEKEARGGRPNRLTAIGYWKATGSPAYVYSSDNRIIGEKRTMVFYKGRAPGSKTDWKMNEYRAIDHADTNPILRLEFSLCRVYVRSKCIRSYDRRPSSSASRSIRRESSPYASSLMVSNHQHPPITSSNHQQNQSLVMLNEGDRSGNSRENSLSSDGQIAYSNDVHTSETDDNNNLGNFTLGDEPLWEWEPYLNLDEWMLI